MAPATELRASYAVGDIQGCRDALERLLDATGFDPRRDRLYPAGDLVNRGPDSAGVMRRLWDMREHVSFVLGNHDLYALSRWAGIVPAKKSDTLASLLADKEAEAWMDWLRHAPLLLELPERPWLLVHAAIHPDWSVDDALGHAEAVAQALQGRRWRSFLRDLWEAPAPERWQDCRTEMDAQRFRVAVFTRARRVRADGRFFWPSKTPADSAYQPWHVLLHERQPDMAVVCGHWATQGLLQQPHLLALDSGCVWGRQLSAARISPLPVEVVQVSCPAYAQPEASE
ncbi:MULTISPECIES: symmetrical bis(5'-nucleosyl)-tetraphosphatase [Acidithiobacillus]|jgi:bis(5'-nucleosyl)-tetraphosphatase (symmetrical)|uniref:bis(5'-nucleosyl)-tetraphosphatase (symmetrical) n=5 Tax=Acidithiobacillus caldus TaxID=33059 RepID=F9ZMJ5_ACICS|nr:MULTISPECIES: symmetrical bis(5'-nucleosyl)-tetraphosphatase [Acidithiobacillus]AEK57384.1 Bis(5'-nucleosyl)-tetraphosphatase, symmetrical [Acidithiobacillus caldus SM-1]AIA54643.1 Bis(5'-nucleosyl)-tetraphosphatase, symmetrical [Acidithiobacillus caldus ATCC 51756]AUW32129.1 symmetrical bis(5'-nucleosyl)-tetraphosphatase [Acidithiobacillus caldus]MBU2728959.1 symmetrical bis(5'-nucleosyl)-tetraphosphatase [Acidithiobacillus caldus]MBU2735883.1 symmetrical bis(5'-nucleosyl)-tetraphosphatase